MGSWAVAQRDHVHLLGAGSEGTAGIRWVLSQPGVLSGAVVRKVSPGEESQCCVERQALAS